MIDRSFDEQQRLERAFGLARLVGVGIICGIGPFSPNLGLPFVFTLGAVLLVYALVVRWMSDTAHSAEEHHRVTVMAVGADIALILSAMLLFSPDAAWTTWAWGGIVVVGAGFRLGSTAAFTVAVVFSLSYLGMSFLRDGLFGYNYVAPHRLASGVALYLLTALVTSGIVGELHGLNRNIQAQSARLRVIVDGTLQAFIGLDAEGLVVDFNPQAEALFGWRRDEIVGRSMSETLLPLVARQAFPAPAAWLVATGETQASTRGRSPILHHDGRLIDCEVSATAVRLPSGEVIAGAFVHDITEEQRRDAELQRLALFDPVTALPNRTLFQDRFGLASVAAGLDGSLVALATINLDQFKAVNDSLGPTAGDEVLREIGHRLGATLQPGDTVARIGGDEFGLILSALLGPADAEARMQECLVAIRQPCFIGASAVHVTASAGLTVGPPSYGSFMDFLRGANIAATDAKRHGGDRLVVASAESSAPSTETMGLVADLHLALERREVLVVYQPIVDLASRACQHVEALARWKHPDRGVIPPTEFIPLAERWHLIRLLGSRILEQALDDVVKWRSEGRIIGVSVNVSADQLGDPGFVDAVLRTLSSRGLKSGALTLELTEATFIDRNSQIVADLTRLRGAGIRISIDDFGTGYSSIAALGELPVDEVKIDRAIVAAATGDPARAAVVRATAALAGAFQIPFVAEGVEDEATWDLLRELEHGSVQGYFVSRPMYPDALVPWLAKWERS